MKSFYLFCLLLTLSISTFAKSKDTTLHYRILIEFKSFCCGTPSDSLLVRYIKKTKKNCNFKKIYAYKIYPLGKEGEYSLGFTLKGMTLQQRKNFIAGAKKIVPKMKDKGSVILLENQTLKSSQLPPNINIEKISF